MSLAPHIVLILAAILAGEAPVALMGRDAAVGVAWTMRNRMELWGHTVEQIEAAYYGRGDPTWQEIEVIQEVFRAGRDGDPTGGAFWAMSKQDKEAWHFRPGDVIYRSPVSKAYEIHLYRSSPFEDEDRRPIPPLARAESWY